MSTNLAPVSKKERFIVLDALRGFALLGICMANFPEFSLYSFMSKEAISEMSTSEIDNIVQWFLYIFIDGKFYTIFSLLFGLGFSIIIENIKKNGGNEYRIFGRRMFFLLLIGSIHLMFIWSGDILMLYAIVGFLLPLFLKSSNRLVLILSAFSLILPIIIDFACENWDIYLSSTLYKWQWYYCDKYGITENNFAYWLKDANNYGDVFKFLIQGALERMQEFVDGNRYFKVFGLFLIGFYIGRNKFYTQLQKNKRVLIKIASMSLCLGIPLSVIYAWSAINAKPLGLGVHSLFYFMSVYLTSFGYISIICLLFIKNYRLNIWNFLALPGRMALTNYIGQSIVGVLIFYGIGFGFGNTLGLFYVELIVIGVFTVEVIFSSIWLGIFKFGPLEWIWRCLTYGKFFPIK